MPSCKVITKRRRLFLNGFHRILSRHTHSGATGKGRLISIAHWNKDEWSGFAALLANLIEKDAVVLNLDALPDLVIEEAVPEKDRADEMIHENDIEPVKAA